MSRTAGEPEMVEAAKRMFNTVLVQIVLCKCRWSSIDVRSRSCVSRYFWVWYVVGGTENVGDCREKLLYSIVIPQYRPLENHPLVLQSSLLRTPTTAASREIGDFQAQWSFSIDLLWILSHWRRH